MVKELAVDHEENGRRDPWTADAMYNPTSIKNKSLIRTRTMDGVVDNVAAGRGTQQSSQR